MANNHNVSTESSGGPISKFPGLPDVLKATQIFTQTKSVNYADIIEKALPDKYKEAFRLIPMCIDPLANLLKSLGMKPYQGGASKSEEKDKSEETEKADNAEKTDSSDSSSDKTDSSDSSSDKTDNTDASSDKNDSSDSDSKTDSDKTNNGDSSGNGEADNSGQNDTSENADVAGEDSAPKDYQSGIMDCIKNCVDAVLSTQDIITQLTGDSDLTQLITDTAKQFIDPDSDFGKTIIENVFKMIQKADTKSNKTNYSQNAQNMDFIDFTALDLDNFTSTERNKELETNPEAIITQGSLDATVNASESKLSTFTDRFQSALNNLVNSMQRTSDQDTAYVANSISSLLSSNAKLAVISDQIKTSYKADFSASKMDCTDLPLEWRPK